MHSNNAKCIKTVGELVICPVCNSASIRYGKNALGEQRYQCKACSKNFLLSYRYCAYKKEMNEAVKEHVKEGCGIRSIARLLKISATTVLKRILSVAKSITKPFIALGKEYELDELCTYVKKKTNLRWVVYAIRKDTKEVIDFAVGCRTNKTLKLVTDTLILSNASRVYTDKLQQYGSLIPDDIHCTMQYGTNHIERKNLNLRTHIKRLGRRTICS